MASVVQPPVAVSAPKKRKKPAAAVVVPDRAIPSPASPAQAPVKAKKKKNPAAAPAAVPSVAVVPPSEEAPKPKKKRAKPTPQAKPSGEVVGLSKLVNGRPESRLDERTRIFQRSENEEWINENFLNAAYERSSRQRSLLTKENIDSTKRKIEWKYVVKRNKIKDSLTPDLEARLAAQQQTEWETTKKIFDRTTSSMNTNYYFGLEPDEEAKLIHWRKKKNPPPSGAVPEPASSGYLLFYKENRPAFVENNANKSFGEIGTMVGAAWRALGEDAQAAYNARAKANKEKRLSQDASVAAVTAAATASKDDMEDDDEEDEDEQEEPTPPPPPPAPKAKSGPEKPKKPTAKAAAPPPPAAAQDDDEDGDDPDQAF